MNIEKIVWTCTFCLGFFFIVAGSYISLGLNKKIEAYNPEPGQSITVDGVTYSGDLDKLDLIGAMLFIMGIFFDLVSSIMIVNHLESLPRRNKDVFITLGFGILFTGVPAYLIHVIRNSGDDEATAMCWLLGIFIPVGAYMLIRGVIELFTKATIVHEWPGLGVSEDKFEEYKQKYRYQYETAMEMTRVGMAVYKALRLIAVGILMLLASVLAYNSLSNYLGVDLKILSAVCVLIVVAGVVNIVLGIVGLIKK